MPFSERAALNWLATHSTRAWVDKNRYGWMRDMSEVAGGFDSDVFHWNVREDDSERYIVHQVMEGVGRWYVDISAVKQRLIELCAEDTTTLELLQAVELIRNNHGFDTASQLRIYAKEGLARLAKGQVAGDKSCMAILLMALDAVNTRANQLASLGSLHEQLAPLDAKLDQLLENS